LIGAGPAPISSLEGDDASTLVIFTSLLDLPGLVPGNFFQPIGEQRFQQNAPPTQFFCKNTML